MQEKPALHKIPPFGYKRLGEAEKQVELKKGGKVQQLGATYFFLYAMAVTIK